MLCWPRAWPSAHLRKRYGFSCSQASCCQRWRRHDSFFEKKTWSPLHEFASVYSVRYKWVISAKQHDVKPSPATLLFAPSLGTFTSLSFDVWWVALGKVAFSEFSSRAALSSQANLSWIAGLQGETTVQPVIGFGDTISSSPWSSITWPAVGCLRYRPYYKPWMSPKLGIIKHPTKFHICWVETEKSQKRLIDLSQVFRGCRVRHSHIVSAATLERKGKSLQTLAILGSMWGILPS